jgi:hypothetical protein
MRRAFLAAPVVALLLSGCGAAADNQESKFTEGSDQAQIASLVDKLSTAGAARDADTICTEVLATTLVNELKAANGNCVTEMDRAIKDASDYDLQIVDVKVNGSTATARIAQGDTDARATFTFVKEKGGWRATALGGS